MGTIGIRALAGGALSGSEWRHPIGAEVVGPIGTGEDYRTDVARGMAFGALVRGGWADSIAEAAMRFAVGETGLSTALVGVSTIEQLEAAIEAAERGPLPAEAMAEVERIWNDFAAEAQAGASR
jgi:aryl-alcohol dehydrogenase-like predicted oxidoreductase